MQGLQLITATGVPTDSQEPHHSQALSHCSKLSYASPKESTESTSTAKPAVCALGKHYTYPAQHRTCSSSAPGHQVIQLCIIPHGWIFPEICIITTQETSAAGASQSPHLSALIHRKHFAPSPDRAMLLSELKVSWPALISPTIPAPSLARSSLLGGLAWGSKQYKEI